MLYTSQLFRKASGKLGPLVADNLSPVPVAPPSLPVAASSFRSARPPLSATSRCRASPPSLLRDAQAAWSALSPAARANWDYNATRSYLDDRLGKWHHPVARAAFFKIYMLLSSHGALNHFDLEQLFVLYDFNFCRFHSLDVNLHYTGYFVFTIYGFIPFYWGSTSPDSLLFFSHTGIPSTLRARYRGNYVHRNHIPFGANSGRPFDIDFLSDYKPDPYQPLRVFFRLSFLDTYLDLPNPPISTILYFSKTSKGYVDYLGA